MFLNIDILVILVSREEWPQEQKRIELRFQE